MKSLKYKKLITLKKNSLNLNTLTLINNKILLIKKTFSKNLNSLYSFIYSFKNYSLLIFKYLNYHQFNIRISNYNKYTNYTRQVNMIKLDLLKKNKLINNYPLIYLKNSSKETFNIIEFIKIFWFNFEQLLNTKIYTLPLNFTSKFNYNSFEKLIINKLKEHIAQKLIYIKCKELYILKAKEKKLKKKKRRRKKVKKKKIKIRNFIIQ